MCYIFLIGREFWVWNSWLAAYFKFTMHTKNRYWIRNNFRHSSKMKTVNKLNRNEIITIFASTWIGTIFIAYGILIYQWFDLFQDQKHFTVGHLPNRVDANVPTIQSFNSVLATAYSNLNFKFIFKIDANFNWFLCIDCDQWPNSSI